MDVRFHWSRDKVDQGLLQVLRCPGPNNPADLFTKGHTGMHLRIVRGMFVDTDQPAHTSLPVHQSPAVFQQYSY